MKKIAVEEQITLACRRALNLQNQDVLSATCGCFDRRFWAWKLIDYPEATFQRLILPLCWHAQIESEPLLRKKYDQAVYYGLKYAMEIQHKDGSFDQAYPHEHSFGATAFLLHPLQVAFEYLVPTLDQVDVTNFEKGLYRAAGFLADHEERHAFISNHLAGCALALLETGNYFNEPGFISRAEDLLSQIVEKQSPEGWYLEYEGADAGYQTLCMDYLAQFYRIKPSLSLLESLTRSVHFLSFFAHPDGTFGGEYGSRRTAVYYPGGLALLADEIPAAAGLHAFMLKSIERGTTVGVMDMDVGNLAPLLSSTMLMHKIHSHLEEPQYTLPCHEDTTDQELSAAGLYIKGNRNYYSILGISNGGVYKVWNKKEGTLIHDDCGLLAYMQNGRRLTSQHTGSDSTFHRDGPRVDLTAPLIAFHPLDQSTGKFILLRLANLTLMRFSFFNELVKKRLAKLLVRPSHNKHLVRNMHIVYEKEKILVEETLSGRFLDQIERVTKASAFTSIHMAAARYPLSTRGVGKETHIDFQKEQEQIIWREEIDTCQGGKE
ncbi:MAG: hypothetical protein GYA52_06790 [Chloroflexi bacterium]|nr:hypothetical protein [Chloroflexota bacterium]